MKFSEFLRRKINFKMIRNIVLFLGLIVLTFWFVFKDQNPQELISVITSVQFPYVLLGLVFMFFYFVMESYNVKCILKVLKDKRISIFKALKFTFIGYFFSAITPAATGGQPVEIYYMTKENIKGANATLALLIQLCGFQISTLTFGLVSAILNPGLLKDGLLFFFLLGFAINGFALAIMLICVFSKRLTDKLSNFLMKLLKKLKVSDLETKKSKIQSSISQYHESSLFIKSHKFEFVKSILRVFVQIACYYMVPICVYQSFGLEGYSILNLFSMQAVLYTMVSGLPLPGAIGVSETIFLSILGVAFGETLIGGAMLLSRIISFYFFVLLSLVVVIITAIRKRKVQGEIDLRVLDIEQALS